jgi:putative AdoMet-dependent methyltransferase
VARYDRNQGTDAARDNALLDRLGVRAGTRLVDLACGTGSLVVEAARRGADAAGWNCWSARDAVTCRCS